MHTPLLQIRKLDVRATVPSYQSAQAAGLDLSACLPESAPQLVLKPGDIVLVPCGFAMSIPIGYEAQVRARSGLASKHGITVPNGPGTIDSDYRGEVKVAIINLGREAYTITHGQRIAQMVVAPVAHAVVKEVETLDDTARGSGGFGSTGVH